MIWSLTVQADQHPNGGIVTTLHASELDAITALRENYDDQGEYAEVPDDEIIQSLIDMQGLVIYIDQHDTRYITHPRELECDGCDLDPWAPPKHYGTCPLAPMEVTRTDAGRPPHVPYGLTAGELADILTRYPRETPLLGYIDTATPVNDYVNVDGVHFDPTNPDTAITIEMKADYDTRQF